MNPVANLLRAYRRYRNRKARARRYVRLSPQADTRSWSGQFMRGLKP
jgi:hypothetical protein